MKSATVVVVLVAGLLVGCGKEESQPAPAAPESGAGLMDKAREMGQSAVASAEEAVASLKAQATQQVGALQKQYETLKASADQLKDSDLSSMAQQMKQWVDSAQAKVQEMSGASKQKAADLQSELAQLIQEKIKPLYEKAMAKIASLKSQAPAVPQTPAVPEAPAAPALPQ